MAVDDDQKQFYSFNTGKIRPFHEADYAFFIGTLLISAGIGVFYAWLDWYRGKENTAEFLLGGKAMGVFPVAMSLTVTFMSALTLLGNPAEIYVCNTMWWYLSIAHIVAIVATAYIFMPFFFQLRVTSVFEYLQMRFGTVVRVFGAVLLILQTLFYSAFLLYAPSLAINEVTGVSLWGSAVAIGIIVTFYTTLGGMKAVLWTDTFQAGIILAGLLSVLIRGAMVTGGFAKAWEVADKHGRVVFDEVSVSPKARHSVWSMIIGGSFFWIHLYGLNQAQIQRCLSCPTIEKARAALFINLPGLWVIVGLCCMIGIVMFAFYVDCDPIKYGIIHKNDQLVPLFVSDILGHLPGMAGVFLSCVVSGSLSSLSSGLNALSAVTFSDILKNFNCFVTVSDYRSQLIAKALVFGYGLFGLGFAYVVSKMGSVLQAVYVVFGLLNGPVLGVMTMGMFCPWANKHGALYGMLGAIGLSFWIGFGQFINIPSTGNPVQFHGCNWSARSTPAPLPPKVKPEIMFEELYRLSYMWFTALGCILVWFFGLIITLITGPRNPQDLDPRLIIPIFDYILPFLPESWLKPLRFGIDHEGKWERNRSPFHYSVDISYADNTDEALTQSQMFTSTGEYKGQPRFSTSVDEPTVMYELVKYQVELGDLDKLQPSTSLGPNDVAKIMELAKMGRLTINPKVNIKAPDKNKNASDQDTNKNATDTGENDADTGKNDTDTGYNDTDTGHNLPDTGYNEPDTGDTKTGTEDTRDGESAGDTDMNENAISSEESPGHTVVDVREGEENSTFIHVEGETTGDQQANSAAGQRSAREITDDRRVGSVVLNVSPKIEDI